MDIDEVNLDINTNGDDVDVVEENSEFLDDDIKDDDLIYQIPKFSRTILYHGNSLTEDDWIRHRLNTEFDLKYFHNSFGVKEPYKYMSSKIIESNEILNDFLDDFIYDIKERCRELSSRETENTELSNVFKDLAEEDSLTTKFNVRTAVETYYGGRICYGFVNGRLNFKNVYLESNSSMNSKSELILLDLSMIKSDETSSGNYSLFSGQIVIIKGQNPNGNYIRVTKFIDLNDIFKPQFPIKCPQLLLEKEPINIICACGPFVSFNNLQDIDLTDKSYMLTIADYLKQYNPDVLFLFGPFFEDSQIEIIQKWSLKETLTKTTTYPYQWSLERLFVYQLRTLTKEIEGLSIHTKIVVVPSANELSGSKIFPTYPFDMKLLKPAISFSNPSIISIGGISVGLSATDVLLHLSRVEIYRDSDNSKNSERLKRLCGHVLSQRNFYPIIPPDRTVNMEYTLYKHLKMPVTPHLLILPSILRPFIYNVNETIVINPGKVARNSIARIKIDPIRDSNCYSGSLSQYINVEVIKLNKDF